MSAPYSSGPSRKSRLRQRSGVQRGFTLPTPAVPEEEAPEQMVNQPETLETPAPAAAETDPQDRPSTAARPRVPFVHTSYGYASPPNRHLRRWLIALALLGCGIAAGYYIGASGQSGSQVKKHARVDTIETVDKPPSLTEDERTQLDTAFSEGRARHYKESEQIFTSLVQKHPAWSKVPLEIARMDIYQEDYIGAQRILSGLMQGTSDARPDAFFLTGVLNLKAGNFRDAETSFAAATDADPTRSEYFYFWGDCLRQEGKPQEAGIRFRSALQRNQYETAEDLLQLKVWLCDISTDQEKIDGADAAINAALAMPFPRAAALLAAAARSMKADRFAEAAAFIARGRAAMDQIVFNVVLHDPSFFQESWRPELAPFYKPAGAPQPLAGRAPAAAPGPSASASPGPSASASPGPSAWAAPAAAAASAPTPP
jgi:Tfp pilus assembly protein PilF